MAAGALINGALQYKTALAWAAGGEHASFVLADKAVAICKISNLITGHGTTMRRLHSGGSWSAVGGFQGGPTKLNTQEHVVLMRVNTTLYAKTTSTWQTFFVLGDPYGDGNALADYQATIAMDGGGVITASIPAWGGPTDYGIVVNDIYDYQLQGFYFSGTEVTFSQIQIYYPGF